MCIVGSSGVGKSTLVNQLYGEEWQWTGEVNETTGKGRHTTTTRELVPLPGGGMLIDNPGMREIQMWTDETTLRESFSDVEAIAADCRYCRLQPPQRRRLRDPRGRRERRAWTPAATKFPQSGKRNRRPEKTRRKTPDGRRALGQTQPPRQSPQPQRPHPARTRRTRGCLGSSLLLSANYSANNPTEKAGSRGRI